MHHRPQDGQSQPGQFFAKPLPLDVTEPQGAHLLQTAAPKPAPVTVSGAGMDVFGVHRTLIKDYRFFTEGGTVIRDDRIAAFVEDDLNSKSQWPDPWLSLNPSFQGGGTVVELAGQQVLHDECARIFQAKKTKGGTSARDALTSRYPDAVLHVVVDATFRHKVADEERAAVDSALGAGDLIQPPAGTEGKGDALVTAIAEDTGGTVVTNDNYAELQNRHPWLRDKERVLGVTLSQGRWVFTPRTCVPPRHRIVRAEVPQQFRALIPPSPGPLPEFRYHRPHEE
ncbi:hypothetical protein AB0M58_01225 [Streptomyces bobili]|uniref:hypothetical protein n=1 Tax=Streptomyces bobili TaxID=67280 RepID=UPI00343EECE0